jgi:hypothetical protein
MSAEIVYVLSNPAMPGLLKIGMTDNGDLAVRMKGLYTTGVPLPFDCVYACIVGDNEDVERIMHDKFAKQRLNPHREFFKIKPLQALKSLKPFEEEDITPRFRKDLDAPLTEAERDARRAARRKAARTDPSIAEAKNLHLELGN